MHGREPHLRALARLIATRPLITLVGPGGIGKTWLARRALDEHRASGGPGWFCAAERAHTDAELVEAIENAAESHAPGLGDIEARFDRALAHLSGQAGLLVIDNVEQLGDLAPRIGQLLGAGVTILLTSRRRLHLDGEQIFPVDGLGAAARQLFMRRARVVDPLFDETRPGFDDLLVRLDGVPLAIEFAAGRMGSFTPRDILDRLDRSLIEHTQHERPVRQSSIEQSHAWSWALCTPTLQAALGRCTVFVGGFDLDAAERMLGADAIELIQALVDRSLLSVERGPAGTRFSMHQLWRDFVGQRTPTAQLADAQAVHRDWYLQVGQRAAANAHGPDGAPARRWLLTERANLGAIADAGVWQAVWVLRTLLHYGGLPLRYPTWVEACDGPVAGLLKGELALQRGQLAEAVTALHPALETVDAAHRWEVQLCLGIAEVERGGPDAMRHHTAALEDARAVGNLRGVGRALGSQGVTLRIQGDLRAARDRYDQAFDALREAGDVLSLGILTLQTGDIHVQAGRLTEARLAYTAAHEKFAELGSKRWLGFTSGKLGAIALEEGKPRVAITRCEEAVEQLTRAGCVREAGVFAGYVGLACHAAGDLERALRQYTDAQVRIRSDRRHCALFASFAAVAAHQLDQPVDYWLTTADALAAEIPGQLDVQCTIRLNRAHARLALDPVGAEAALDAAIDEAVGTDARLARRWLAAALGKAEPVVAPDALRVWPQFDRFEPPGGSPIDIGRRRTLVRIFRALVLARRDRPGAGLSLEELQAVGWPGERMSPVSGANRVYVAIATLRANGMRDLLLKREVGYLLDPRTPLVLQSGSVG